MLFCCCFTVYESLLYEIVSNFNTNVIEGQTSHSETDVCLIQLGL